MLGIEAPRNEASISVSDCSHPTVGKVGTRKYCGEKLGTYLRRKTCDRLAVPDDRHGNNEIRVIDTLSVDV
jgi:hypothetical protein